MSITASQRQQMPVRTGICCLFYDTACVMKLSALRRTQAGQGQRAAEQPLPYFRVFTNRGNTDVS